MMIRYHFSHHYASYLFAGIIIKQARSRKTEIPAEEREGYLKKLKRISSETDLWYSFSELKRLLPKHSYEDAIKEKIYVRDKGKIESKPYELLWKLNIKGIVTFNLDSIAEDIFARLKGYTPDISTAKETAIFPNFISSGSHFIFHPHGKIQDSNTWVFTEEEKTDLLGTEAYKSFMKTLFNSKHVVIMGFNVEDFSFKYLLQEVLMRNQTGSRHYVFLPNCNPVNISSLGNKGFAVIPYSPDDDKKHNEIAESLEQILKFIPEDDIVPSVYNGPQQDPSELPGDDLLISYPTHKLREILNGAISAMIPPGTSPNESDIEKLETFYKSHMRAIHMAWLIEPKSECEIVHNYKVIQKLERGAFGQVYEGENIQTTDRVAIKVLLPEIRENREYLNSFRRGVRSMRILTEHGLKKMVRLIDAYEVPACIIMDFIDGPTLTTAINDNIISNIKSCLSCLTQIGEVVQQAHNLDERVLHRDLKPDNVIIKNGYIEYDNPDVIVVDFDLSWHKGASELSVVHGARAQGYAAPEQTATGRRRGISTRNVAVDVFGYGMLGYFILVGKDPRPNEQNFDNFEKNIRDAINRRFSNQWKSLPSFLANIIVECTKDEQEERIPFSSAVAAFKNAYHMSFHDSLSPTNTLILEEIVCNISENIPCRKKAGNILSVNGPDHSIKTRLELSGDRDELFVLLSIQKNRSGSDHRNVKKYLPSAKDKALSKLKSPFINKKGDIGQGNLTISAKWPLNETVTRKEILDVVQIIINTRSELKLQ